MVQSWSSLSVLIVWGTQGRIERDGRSRSLSTIDGRVQVEKGNVVERREKRGRCQRKGLCSQWSGWGRASSFQVGQTTSLGAVYAI